MTRPKRPPEASWVFSLAFAVTAVTLSSAAPFLRRTHSVEFVHHDNAALHNVMLQVAKDCPIITRLYSIGKSVKGVDLYVMEISDNPGVHEPGEPEFKYVGNMHGNEVTGRETLLHLMRDLCDRYGADESVTRLVDTTRIHILPTMNPDGYAVAGEGDETGLRGRINANGVDLNRNFPDRLAKTEISNVSLEPETQAVMKWLEDYPFVLSANFHNGALVANYPYDNSLNGLSVYTPSEDNDIFVQLSLAYSRAHATMSRGNPCQGDATSFKDGITNGAAWYSVSGGMQDYNYLRSSCFEITVEQGCVKFPSASDLEDIWNANKGAMYAFMAEAHKGVRGFVADAATGKPIVGATLSLVSFPGRSVRTAKDGDFWRLLVPGTYTLAASAPGYLKLEQTVVVERGAAVEANFSLRAEKVSITQTQGSAVDTTTTTASTNSLSTATVVDSFSTPVTVKSDASVAIEASLATTSSGHVPSRSSQVLPMVIVGIILLVILLLLGAIVTFSVIIACHFIKSKHTRQGFAPLPLEEQSDRRPSFNYKMVSPPTSLPLVEAPAYNDDPPAELPVSLASDTEEIIYSASGVATSKP